MPDNLLQLLKLCLLALLYLFFLRVLWAVWQEVRPSRAARASVAAGGAPVRASDDERPNRKSAALPPTSLVVVEPTAQAGLAYHLDGEVTLGRATGCRVSLPDDGFVSSVHARVYLRDTTTFVEDLGSTNGTYLNGERLTAPSPLRRGDRLQVGGTVLEAA